MKQTPNSITELAKVLWNYQRLDEQLEPSDLIIAMGCEDIRVAQRAADLRKQGLGEYIVCTGKSGTRTKSVLATLGLSTEAEWFARTIIDEGVDKAFVIIEDQSTNSAENIRLTKQLIRKYAIDATIITIVTAPYAERRQQATYAAQWPEQRVQITSPVLTFESYPTDSLDTDYLINALVGRVQRMKVYGEAGFQAPVKVPDNVWQAYEKLVALGYTKELVQLS